MSRKATPDSEVRAAHERLTGRLGRAPTSDELGREVGICRQPAANRMRALGLPRSYINQAKITDGEIRAVHARMTGELGRAPTAPELARRLGVRAWTAENAMRRLSLERTRMSRSEAGRVGADATNRIKKARGPRQPERREDDAMQALMRAERERRRRYWAVARSGEGAGDAPKRLPRPGEGMEPWARVKIACAICGREVTITPRTHPWYMRDADGTVRFLCSEQCMRGVDL